MGLNPAIILLSLSIWGTLLGLIGLIIALPLTTLILSYYENYIISKSKNDGNGPKQIARERRDIERATKSPLP